MNDFVENMGSLFLAILMSRIFLQRSNHTFPSVAKEAFFNLVFAWYRQADSGSTRQNLFSWI
jgi:hypothetical protein